MCRTAEIFIKKIYDYQCNKVFTVLPMEQLKYQYLSNIANFLPLILESFNLKVSDLANVNDVYHWHSNLCYATGKYKVDLGTLPLNKLPDDIQKIVNIPKNTENKIKSILRKQNIRPWQEIEKDIKGSKSWLGTNEKLQTALLLDFIYELIASNKNKKLFGEVSALNILHLLKSTVSKIDFVPKLTPYNTYFDSSKYFDPYTYYYNLQQETDKYNNKFEKIDIEDDNLKIETINSTSASKTETILHYYYQLEEPYLNKNHKLYKYYSQQAQYTKGSIAKEWSENIINTEYALLYQQLPYLYIANWLKEVKPINYNLLPSFWSITILDNNNSAKATSKLKDFHLNKDITTILNNSNIYRHHDNNISRDKKCIYQLYYFAYLSKSITGMQEKFKSYYSDMRAGKNTTTKTTNNVIFEIFRFGYLLRHSIFFRAIHADLLIKLGFDDKQVSISAPVMYEPSYFSSTFLYLLSQQHSPQIDIELLKKESAKYTSLITNSIKTFTDKNNDVILQTINKILFAIYSNDSYKPQYAIALSDVVREYLSPFLSIETKTKNWKKLNEILTNYYTSTQNSSLKI